MQLFGYLAVWAVIAVLAGWLSWRYRAVPRVAALSAPVAAFFGAMALVVPHTVLAVAGATQPGMIIAGALVVIGTFITFIEVIAGRHGRVGANPAKRHTPAVAPAIGVVYGLALATVYTDRALMIQQAKLFLPNTGAQLSQSAASVAPAHVVSVSALSQYMPILLAMLVGAPVVVYVHLRRQHKKRPQPSPKPVRKPKMVAAAQKAIGMSSAGGGGRGRKGRGNSYSPMSQAMGSYRDDGAQVMGALPRGPQ